MRMRRHWVEIFATPFDTFYTIEDRCFRSIDDAPWHTRLYIRVLVWMGRVSVVRH